PVRFKKVLLQESAEISFALRGYCQVLKHLANMQLWQPVIQVRKRIKQRDKLRFVRLDVAFDKLFQYPHSAHLNVLIVVGNQQHEIGYKRPAYPVGIQKSFKHTYVPPVEMCYFISQLVSSLALALLHGFALLYVSQFEGQFKVES